MISNSSSSAAQPARAARRPYAGYEAPIDGAIDIEITGTARGTPLGEYMRRFWQPVCLSDELTDLPLAIRILGEDLVAFRDGSGRVGVLARRCCHRGASLEYGIVGQRGIQCCYHGWQFDIDGTILATPGEPPTSRIKDTLCQGAYRAAERHGLVFAYMGPESEAPSMPLYEPSLVPPDNKIVAFSNALPCNWLQVHENIADQAHAVFLHGGMSADRNAKPGEGAQLNASFATMPTLEWQETRGGSGMVFIAGRRVGDHVWIRINDLLLPNITHHAHLFEDGREAKVFANHLSMTRWSVPVDDNHMKLFGWRYFNRLVDPHGRGDPAKCGKESIDFLDGQTGHRPYEEGQRNPGDWEVLTSQGPTTIHGLENPGTTDGGVFLWRNLLRRTLRGQNAAGAPAAIAAFNDRHSPMRTYSQDSVLDVPKRGSDDEDKAMIRQIGREVMATIVAGNDYEGDQRTAFVRKEIVAIGERYARLCLA